MFTGGCGNVRSVVGIPAITSINDEEVIRASDSRADRLP
jgi:hypothetical protein